MSQPGDWSVLRTSVLVDDTTAHVDVARRWDPLPEDAGAAPLKSRRVEVSVAVWVEGGQGVARSTRLENGVTQFHLDPVPTADESDGSVPPTGEGRGTRPCS